MKELEQNVKAIEMDGLVWGASKLVAIGYGIKKLQINLVVEDEKVSVDELQEKIAEDEDHVQSSDVVSLAFFSRLALELTHETGGYVKAVSVNLRLHSASCAGRRSRG